MVVMIVVLRHHAAVSCSSSSRWMLCNAVPLLADSYIFRTSVIAAVSSTSSACSSSIRDSHDMLLGIGME